MKCKAASLGGGAGNGRNCRAKQSRIAGNRAKHSRQAVTSWNAQRPPDVNNVR